MDMAKNNKEYNEKLNELKCKIEEKEEMLFKQISKALADGDNSTYNRLKQMQLQCKAELRLIAYIENGMEGEFFIC